MTERERNLLIFVGVIAIAGLAYNFIGSGALGSASYSNNLTHQAALRLLNSRLNIETRYLNTQRQLTVLEKGFLSAQNLEDSKVKLLKEIEQLAAEVSLEVKEKNIMTGNNQIIGVALGGTAAPSDIYRFLQEVANAKINLKVNRLQLSSLAEQRLLNYQIVLNTLLVEKKGDH